MAGLVVADVGELKFLAWMLNGSPENMTMKLFKNDYTPDQSSTAGSFTECDFTGYSSKTLTSGSWSSPTTVSHKGSSSYAAQTFSCTGGSSQTVYGYYCVGASSGTLLYAERFATSRTVSSGIDLTITPSLTLNSEN